MKKILLSAIIASSFVMSGDIEKCTQSIEMYKKYRNLASENNYEALRKRGEINLNKSMKKEREKLFEKIALTHEKDYNLYTNLSQVWFDEALKECKGILDKKVYGKF